MFPSTALRVIVTVAILVVGVLVGAIIDAVGGLGLTDLEILGAGLLTYHIIATGYVIHKTRNMKAKFLKDVSELGIQVIDAEPGESISDAIKRARLDKKKENNKED